MLESYVSLKQLADEFGVCRSNVRKSAIRAGLKPHKRITPDSSGQLTLAITPEEADYLRSIRLPGVAGSSSLFGEFYVIQLIPELDPKRIKLGYSDHLKSRIAEHQTASPTLRLAAKWPCKRYWEKAAIDFISVGCLQILNEVFECDDIELVIIRGNQWFGLMPCVSLKCELASCSPLSS